MILIPFVTPFIPCSSINKYHKYHKYHGYYHSYYHGMIVTPIGNVIIPIEFHVFQRGRAQPPTSHESPWASPSRPPAPVASPSPNDRLALAFSGGGVRAAFVDTGVLWRLAVPRRENSMQCRLWSRRKTWEKHGKTIGKWENHGKNHRKTIGKWEHYRKTTGKP